MKNYWTFQGNRMVSMDEDEYDEMKIRGRERNRFQDKYEWAIRKLRAQEQELHAVKRRMKVVEALVDDQKRNIREIMNEKDEKETEFKRLKSVEERMIKNDTSKLMETMRRNAELDEEEAHRSGKRQRTIVASPEEALRGGSVGMYYHLHGVRAARNNDPNEVMRYSNLMNDYLKSKKLLHAMRAGLRLQTESERERDKRIAKREAEIKLGKKNTKALTKDDVMKAWKMELVKHAGRWNKLTQQYE